MPKPARIECFQQYKEPRAHALSSSHAWLARDRSNDEVRRHGRPSLGLLAGYAKEHSGIGYNQAAEHAHCVLAALAGSPLCLPPRQEKLLVGAGIAWRYNFNLGGLVWPPLRNSGLESGKILHNVDVCAYIARMGGVPRNRVCHRSPRIGTSTNLTLYEGSLSSANDFSLPALLSDDFLRAVRCTFRPRLAPLARFWGSRRPTVALHVRRGDVHTSNSRVARSVYTHHYVADSAYLDIIGVVLRRYPSADVHAHFATADVFVMGRSCFSLLPALLDPNCVVATVHGSNKMTDEALVRAVPHGMALSVGRAGEERWVGGEAREVGVCIVACAKSAGERW
ncbi:hypothetical protein EMIHUDRAFT_246802 [Emiliania huxleyi CCMP1516]|uniref:Uncharacterized protein n=2 Tax=Emiliania huxleyi TaxID=2903 RepID=A0A0D3IQ96_EMIH1|nr:hypothetical protein EMIHUDRAFT_246802 [Emiliania huxleyi CCMP1516]EOD13431.1 hypothetical protein EMIHUDRAFT_246802 [Emiliania huxleyi CCMP1516]|eukprot:XP_005765860.1 hypothetical protein EMIHUDRAFT_246802 [Emiliania huxleyi CCMP1516]